jgi:hypothetical protein
MLPRNAEHVMDLINRTCGVNPAGNIAVVVVALCNILVQAQVVSDEGYSIAVEKNWYKLCSINAWSWCSLNLNITQHVIDKMFIQKNDASVLPCFLSLVCVDHLKRERLLIPAYQEETACMLLFDQL